MSESYEAEPLGASTHTNFRVLEVQRGGESSGVICCKLRVVFMEEPPPYTAVSYTWGDTTPCDTIKLDDRPFTVAETCGTFCTT
jgi:hypothetical protein